MKRESEAQFDNALPCPFCGQSEFGIVRGTPDREGTPTQIACFYCGALGPWTYEHNDDASAALDLWNKRV